MVNWGTVAAKALILFGMLVGLAGTVIPIFPGVVVIWALALLYGIAFGFTASGVWFFAAITVLAVIGSVVDNLIVGGKARQSGARWTSIALAIITGLLSSIFLTPLVGIPATLTALYLIEYLHRRDHTEAWQVTKGMALGWGWAFAARLSIGLVMIGLWAIWAWQ